jgi:hypothetical protein
MSNVNLPTAYPSFLPLFTGVLRGGIFEKFVKKVGINSSFRGCAEAYKLLRCNS